MNLRWAIAMFSILQAVKCSIKNCCEGENTMVDRKCVDGSINDVMNCTHRLIMETREIENSINEIKGELDFGGLVKGRDSFCRTDWNGTIVYIVCYSPEELEEPFSILPYLGFASSVFLLLTAAVYISFPKLLDLQGLCIVHSVIGLALVFIIMGIKRMSDDSIDFLCHLYAYLLYFCCLYSFFWLSAYSFHLWRTTTQPRILANVNQWKILSYIYSCGCPFILLLLVIISKFSDFYIYIHPRMAEESVCWFATLEATFFYMYGPISLLLIFNIVFFFLTIRSLWKEIHQHDGKKLKIIKYRLALCFKMFFVMGISWIFEVLSAAFEHKYPSILWKVTDTINSLQGLFIFLVMVVFRKRAYRLLAQKSFCQCLPSTWRSIEVDEEEEDNTDDNDVKLDSVVE